MVRTNNIPHTLVVVVAVAVALVVVGGGGGGGVYGVYSHKSLFNPCPLCLIEAVLGNYVCVYPVRTNRDITGTF